MTRSHLRPSTPGATKWTKNCVAFMARWRGVGGGWREGGGGWREGAEVEEDTG